MKAIIKLADGRISVAMNVTPGQDFGEDFHHIQTNISPFVDGLSDDFFLVSEIVEITDEHGDRIFKPAALR